MGKLTAIAFAFGLAVQPHVGRGAQFTDAEIRSAKVMMSVEGHCGFGYEDRTDIRQCPTYTVRISGDGTVAYVGSNGVKTLGIRSHNVPAVAARGLVEAFLRAGFFSLEDRYQSIDYGSFVASIDHAVGTTLSLTISKASKSVYAFYGVPYAIKELERLVEEVTDVRRYTGRPPLPAGSHSIHGRITAASRSALAGVKVYMPGPVSYQAVTDSDGRYSIVGVFAGLFPDDYALIATAEGFVDAVSKIAIKEGSPPLEWNPVMTPHVGPAPLLDLHSRLNRFAQGATADCGQFLMADSTRTEANATTLTEYVGCAVSAQQERRPIRVVVQRPGSDSWVVQGLVSSPNTRLWFFTYRQCAVRQHPVQTEVPTDGVFPADSPGVAHGRRRDNL